MTDIFSKTKRSEIMSKVRSKNTKIELAVFRGLRAKKVYFQKHYRGIIGCPDVAFPRKKIAVFIDGDFWHGYQFAKNKKVLSKKFWLPKIEANIKRDRTNRSKLRRMGWKVLRIWEHEVEKDLEKSVEKIVALFQRIR